MGREPARAAGRERGERGDRRDGAAVPGLRGENRSRWEPAGSVPPRIASFAVAASIGEPRGDRGRWRPPRWLPLVAAAVAHGREDEGVPGPAGAVHVPAGERRLRAGGAPGLGRVGGSGQGLRGHRLLPQQPPGQAVPCGGALLGVRKRPGEPGWPPVQDSEGTGGRGMRGGMRMVGGQMRTVRGGMRMVQVLEGTGVLWVGDAGRDGDD